MDKNIPVYVKHNQTRKSKYGLITTIIKRDNSLFARKTADENSKEFLDHITNVYDKVLKKDLYPLEIIPLKRVDDYTIEFPYINGKNLLDKLSATKNSKDFENVLDLYVNLLESLPSSASHLTEDFEKQFGEYNKKKKYKVVNTGLLDFTLENIIEDKNGALHMIDYEWTYEFPIPKDYILYRTFLYTCSNLHGHLFFDFDTLVDMYITDKDSIFEYQNWEFNFQNEVSRWELNSNAIKQLTQSQDQKNSILNISELFNKSKGLEHKNSELEIELNKIRSDSDKAEAEEFRIFKSTKIWKSLTMYRKFKRYFINFFKNIRNEGIKATTLRIFRKIKHILSYRKQKYREDHAYEIWLKNNKITSSKRLSIASEISQLEYQPLISIVMPVYNVDIKWIKEAIKSIENQIYTNWELCIADDRSTNPTLLQYLHNINNPKIKTVFRETNGHISEATNSALELATGEYVALMDNDDELQPHALAEVVKVLNEDKDTDLIYSDEDKLDMKGKRVDPFFKPDWSPDLFMSTNYLCHLTVIRKEVIDKVGGFRKGYEGSQDYDLFLRVTEQTNNIKHIPDILYSWRKIPGSTASEYTEKSYASNTTKKAIKDSLERRNIQGTVLDGLFPGSFRVKYNIQGKPLVSILIPTKDKYEYIERCLSSLLEKTTYDNYEVIIIDTGSTDKDVLDYYKTLEMNQKIRIIKWEEKFNYSAVNNFGAKYAKGDYLLLLNNDTEIISPDWIQGMLEHAQRKDIGAVGVKLYYPDDRIQHAGVVLGICGGEGKGVAGHAFKFFDNTIQGFPVYKDVIRNYSAVTAACLMVSRNKFDEVNGLDEDFRIAFNDVDFNLKLMNKGYYNIYTPYVELYHHESVSVGTPEAMTRDAEEFSKEIEMMYKRWEEVLIKDPYYNSNLTLDSESFKINSHDVE